MRLNTAALMVLAGLTVALPAESAMGQTGQKLHFTYLWHMEQPIYWPDRQAGGVDRYERAWESIARKDGGAAHPQNNLREIFSIADRVAGYQDRMAESIWAFSFGVDEAGAQISYSGGLIENIQSLGAANQLGYSGSSFNALRNARSWVTLNGAQVPRADIVMFSFHHALMPLVDVSTQRMQIRMYKEIYGDAWGTSVARSKGFFPSEMAFSERMIPVLASEGIEWSVVSAEKISRACADWPFVQGSGGANCDPPNRGDQINPAQGAGAYYRATIDRGCSPAEAFPFALTPRRARYIDPNTGAQSSIIVVPASQSLGWRDGYAPLGISDFNALQTRNDPNRPMLIMLAHDGDNAWGGGFSYYREATPNNVNQARAAGYVPTVVQRYLADHPVPADDFVKVEDGAWVNADGDFGAPQFLNWNWPPVNAQGKIDIENGWAEDIRNWAVITATQNRIDTAQQIWEARGNSVNVRKVVYPDASTNNVERAWHYFGGALNSGYMYYGTSIDMEVKPTIACNNATRLADPVIASAAASGPDSDRTGPTVWAPQRHPWNPGSNNFGPQHGYTNWKSNGDFYVWSFISDVSNVASVTLKYRLDNDGVNSASTIDNETYAGGPGVAAWQSAAMTRRTFPSGNFFNSTEINFFAMPNYIADQYFFRVNNIRNALVDYYIEAVDAKGNVTRSPIERVYVGDGVGGLAPVPQGSGGGGTPTGPAVTLTPTNPVAGQAVTMEYNPAGRPLAGASPVYIHYGTNGWTGVVTPNPAMTFDSAAAGGAGAWKITITLPTTASTLNMAFNNGAGTWDNNGGANFNATVSGAVQPPPPPPPAWSMDGNLDAGTTLVSQNGALFLRAGLRNDLLYVAANNPGGGNDHFIFLASPPGANRAAPWSKQGQVANWAAFLAAENNNGYLGWFDAGAGVATAQARPSGSVSTPVMEGTINLRQEFGTIPASIFLAFAPYPTNDNTAVLSAFQVPPAVTLNGTIEAAEYIEVPTCLLLGNCCPADIANTDGETVQTGGGADGSLDNGDFTAFFAAFFLGDGDPARLAADIANTDGETVLVGGGSDGAVDNGDFTAFFALFFGGCN